MFKNVFELKNVFYNVSAKNNYEGKEWTHPGIINRCQTKRKNCSQRFEEKSYNPRVLNSEVITHVEKSQ